MFITASEYFAHRFAKTPYEETFQNYFSTYFTITNLFTFALILYMQNKVCLLHSQLCKQVTNTLFSITL